MFLMFDDVHIAEQVYSWHLCSPPHEIAASMLNLLKRRLVHSFMVPTVSQRVWWAWPFPLKIPNEEEMQSVCWQAWLGQTSVAPTMFLRTTGGCFLGLCHVMA
jgi:hypothetical protein